MVAGSIPMKNSRNERGIISSLTPPSVFLIRREKERHLARLHTPRSRGGLTGRSPPTPGRTCNNNCPIAVCCIIFLYFSPACGSVFFFYRRFMGFPVFIDIDSPSMTGILLLYYGLFYGSSGGWVSLPTGAIGVRARAGSGVTTSVSACGIGSWVSIHTTYLERRGHGRPPPLPPYTINWTVTLSS